MYTTNTAEATLYQLKHSRANIAVVDSEIQLQKLLSGMQTCVITVLEEENFESLMISICFPLTTFN